MRILVLAPQPFFQVRGTPINVRNVLCALAEAGHEVELLCYPHGESIELPGVRILRSPGVPGIRNVKVGPSLAKFPLDGLMAVFLFVYLIRNRVDLIHAVEESAFFGGWIGRLFRIPLVMDMDSVISDQLAYSGFVKNQWLLNRVQAMERACMRRSKRVLTVCRSLSDAARRIEPDARIVQVEDAPLQETFEPDVAGAAALKKRFEIPDLPSVVYTGNFEAYQGVSLLLDAWQQLELDAVLVLVGGEERHRLVLEEQTAALGIGDRVKFTGPLPMEQMAACQTLADVLVSPRVKGTNTALKLYGYMQAGRGIVATNLETHTQVLDESCAWLVDADASALAAGLRAALSDPGEALRRGALAARRVEEQFGLRRFFVQIQEMYAEIEKELHA